MAEAEVVGRLIKTMAQAGTGELKSLIITDIDAVRIDKTKDKQRAVKCPCAEGEHSSNAAI